MSASKNIRLVTIQDLVSLISTRANSTYTHSLDRKYSLEDRTGDEWDDDFAGAQYEEQVATLEVTRPVEYWSMERDNPIKAAYMRKVEKLQKTMPKKHHVTYYHLYEQGSSYHGEVIELSSELGVMLDGIWSHREAYRGSSWMKRVSGMTLQGMAKRLGQTGIADTVKKAQDLAKRQSEANSRNYARKHVREVANELVLKIDAARKAGIEIPDFSVLGLVVMADEEMPVE